MIPGIGIHVADLIPFLILPRLFEIHALATEDGPVKPRKNRLHPMMTGKVTAMIYWQALRLLLKKTPVFVHPKKRKLTGENTHP